MVNKVNIDMPSVSEDVDEMLCSALCTSSKVANLKENFAVTLIE